MNGDGPPLAQSILLADYRPRSTARLETTVVEAPRFPVVDAHNHLGRWLGGPGDHFTRDVAGELTTGPWVVPDVAELLDTMDACRVEAIVNLDGRWDEELDANLERYDAAHPGRFVTFCHVDWTLAASPGFERKLVATLERSAAAGTRGLKVWKSLGLGFRDPEGELLLPDDPRLFDLWEAAAELALPVLIHTADPVAFFEPLDGRNELLELLARNPDWWYGDPRFPRFERLIASLEAIVAAHRRTTFIGAHVGCYAEDLAWVDRMLERYPNFYVDVAARRPELGRKPRASRRLLVAHPDRVLFGTDFFPPSAAAYRRWFHFLETADECYPYSDADPPLLGRWTISALDLPDDVLEPVYAGNARRLVPGLADVPRLE